MDIVGRWAMPKCDNAFMRDTKALLKLDYEIRTTCLDVNCPPKDQGGFVKTYLYYSKL